MRIRIHGLHLPVAAAFLAPLIALGSTAHFVGAIQASAKPVMRVKPEPAKLVSPIDPNIIAVSRPRQKAFQLQADRIVEISVHLERPSALPPNGRIAAEWSLESEPKPSAVDKGTVDRGIGLYTLPTANWRKVLHALDPDVYLVYRAPVTGKYSLKLSPVTNEAPVGDGPRWREKGNAPLLSAAPTLTPWPSGVAAPVSVSVKPLSITQTEMQNGRTIVECEPNDTPEQAQPITLTPGPGIQTWEITGGADDVEYFDNGRVGRSGDDWYRLDFKGVQPSLFTAQLGIPGQMVAARVRCYVANKDIAKPGSNGHALARANPTSIGLNRLDVTEYFGREKKTVYNEKKPSMLEEGRDSNERVHQQDEAHRASIARMFYPGETYYLRVEANSPGYQLQLRLLRPAPYDDPRMALRQGIYSQIGQVDAWLTNRPRGASIERRIRDSGNLMGTNCMSCHTQSGVWGPAVPFANGYRPENAQNYWHLQNVMYECLRPTNKLKDAANNTSLAPLDLGDGPAGTRAAGFNIVNLERIYKPRKLHSKMQIRTANFVLQTSDPGGINAAAEGSNVGQAVVYLFSAEILRTAWEKTGDPRYFRDLEEKARKALAVEPKFTDDVAVRIDLFHRVISVTDYVLWSKRAADADRAAGTASNKSPENTAKLAEQITAQMAKDIARLRAMQNPDGTWSFNPGTTLDDGKTWQHDKEAVGDPSPTALAINALHSAGFGTGDPAIAKATKALLSMQDPSGRWNRAAITGFVTTAYCLNALGRLYPVQAPVHTRSEFTPVPSETLTAAIRRVQTLALTGDPRFADLLAQAAQHESPFVRFWAAIGLGATHTEQGVSPLVSLVRDRTKMVREAAIWALRQTLLDDRGWNPVFAAFDRGDDYARAGIVQALNMRADAVMPRSAVDFKRLTSLIDRAINVDPHPGVRAWAGKAAWQWWVWNPPVRKGINAAWLKLLERPEANAVVENANRYSSQALFVANGHKANGSKEHQYKELSELFEAITQRLDDRTDMARRARLAQRLVAIGGTFFATAGGDGGPGQMGYVTPGSGEMMGKAALAFLQDAKTRSEVARIKAGIEGGANVPHTPLNELLVGYSLNGPEELRQLAASAVSDPRTVTFAAVPELVGPQLAQVKRGAIDPGRRAQISEPIIDIWAKVNWNIPKTEEQQRAFFDLIIPRFPRYVSPAEIAAMPDPSQRSESEREMSAAWYLADRLGEVLQQNPDLHHDIVFRRYFPVEFRNPLEEHFWLRSVEWLLGFNPTPTPVKGARTIALEAQDNKPPDESLTIKDRALQLYLDALKKTANPKTRDVALRMANKTSLRTNPEVLRALEAALPGIKDAELHKLVSNVVRQGTATFMPELLSAIKDEKHPSVQFANGEPGLSDPQKADILYFRDYVVPELSRQKRTDQQSCMGCHGVPGRVPTFTLTPPDKYGYLPVRELLANYRIVQSKVNLDDPEKSKLLRKPLNTQDGVEDGHQGGRRFTPTDEGWLILKRWVENQGVVQKKAVGPDPPVPGSGRSSGLSSHLIDLFAIGSLSATHLRTSVTRNGTIVIPGPGSVTLLTGDTLKEYASDNGRVSMPEGEYRIMLVKLTRADDRGRKWTAVIQLKPPNDLMQVYAKKSVQIACGPPFALDVRLGNDRDRTIALAYRREGPVEVSKAGPRDISIRLTCSDRAGNMVTAIFGPDGTKVMPPVFRAATPAGIAAGTTSFEYG